MCLVAHKTGRSAIDTGQCLPRESCQSQGLCSQKACGRPTVLKFLDEGASESSWKMRLKDVYSGAENVELHPWLFIICLFHELLEVCGHPVGFLKSDEFCGPYSESVMFLNA